MPTLEEIVAVNRRRLLRREALLVADIARLYAGAITDLEQRSLAAAGLVQRRIREGASPFSALLTERRIQVLLQQLEAELARISRGVFQRVEAERHAAVIASARDFAAIMEGLDVRTGLDLQALERAGMALQPGAPVARLFAGLPSVTQERARQALFTGIAAGDNPRKTAARLRSVLEGSSARAETIARTETMRAYREGMRDRMREQGIDGWVWISARDRRTCAFCWAQHGRRFRGDQPMSTHPNCRCSQGPLPGNRPPLLEPGAAAFAHLPATTQLTVLGPAKYRAYRDGAISLDDLVGFAQHPVWGPVGFERSLKAVLGERALRYYAA